MRRSLPLYLAAALLALSLTPNAIFAQSLGDSKVVAPVPPPGYPEGIATRGNRFYVSGPATFGAPLGSAYVHAYDINHHQPIRGDERRFVYRLRPGR
jgi:hypothetical protein